MFPMITKDYNSFSLGCYSLITIIVRDSNPRYHVMGIPDFESSAFGHSANLPRCFPEFSEKQLQNY